jgi:hypothetical protein
MSRFNLVCLFLASSFFPNNAQDDVVSSGWSAPAESESSDIEYIEGSGLVTAEDPYPELSWPRAGGAIFDPSGSMFKDSVEVLMYSLMGEEAKVHYTIDGTEPTNQSTTFTTKVNFQGVGDFILKACVSAPERRDSVVVEQHYYIREESAAPTLRATVLDPDNPESVNTSLANDHYLGSFEDGASLTFYTSTSNADIRFTFDGQDPTDDYGNMTVSGQRVLLDIFGNTTIKSKTFPHQGTGFPSSINTYWVEIHPRPPRPAYSWRREKVFMRDMEAKYLATADKHATKVLYPDDLETYIVEILNPDAGLCDDCYISDQEGKIITDAAKEMKIYEGLHEDNTLKLYPGFLMRGSCHRFIHKLNTRMREFRWQTRNKTLALPEALEHTGVDL